MLWFHFRIMDIRRSGECKQIVYFHQRRCCYPGAYNPLNAERMFNYKHIFPRIVKRTWVKNTVLLYKHLL